MFKIRVNPLEQTLDQVEEHDCLNEIFGTIIDVDDDSEHAIEREAGEIHLSYINVEMAWHHRVSVSDVYDTTQELWDVFEAIWGGWDNAGIGDHVRDVVGDVIDVNVIYVNRVYVQPHYRGHDLGLHALRRMLEFWGCGVHLVVIKPHPILQSIDDMTKQEIETAIQGLTKYYERMGFKSIPGTPFMGLSLANVQPDLLLQDLVAS